MPRKEKKKRNQSPAQLANLKPIQKGEVRNPEGGRAHNPIRRALRNLTIKEYREVIEAACTCNLDALMDMIKDPTTSAIQVGIATALWNAIKAGELDVMEMLISRLVGKIPDKIEIDSNNRHTHSNIDRKLAAECLKELEEDV